MHPLLRSISIIFHSCSKITGCKFNLLVYISAALLDNCTSYLFLVHKAQVKSSLYAIVYAVCTHWMYKGSIAVLRGVGSRHTEGRGTGDVSESRAYTHRRRENMVANWLRHSSEAVLRVPFEISSFLSFSTRVPRHEEGRKKGERERERRGTRVVLYEKNSPLKLSTRKEPPPCRLPLPDPLRSLDEESSGGIYTFFTPKSRTQRIIAGLCLIMRGARALPFTKLHVRNGKRRHKESAFLS